MVSVIQLSYSYSSFLFSRKKISHLVLPGKLTKTQHSRPRPGPNTPVLSLRTTKDQGQGHPSSLHSFSHASAACTREDDAQIGIACMKSCGDLNQSVGLGWFGDDECKGDAGCVS